MDNKKQYIRKGQKVTFSAKLKKGDKSLTSWIVYEGNQCDDDHIIKEEKQVGTEFTFTFEKAGEYTIISYGKREEIKKKSKCINKTSISPKTNNEGKEEIVVDKLDSGCAIRLKVIENTIVSIDCVENKIRNAVRKGTTDNWELKKGASVTFKANFYIEKPTEEELSSLKMFVLDSNKNILVAQEGNNISFTPENNNEEYTIVAEHITPSGDKITKKITGKCVLNSVISIKPDKPGELFRPNEEIIFKVDRMKFSADLEDTSRTKWYLNTILKQEGGETFKFSSDKKDEYFVEAANIKPNSSNNKKDPDTCVFKIVDNEVKSISIKGMPKVGRPFELNAKTTFPDLTSEEIQKIKWDIPFNYKEDLGSLNINPWNRTAYFHNTQGIKDPRTIKMTPLKAGTFKVSCRINSEIVEKNIEIVQPKISSAHWIDKDGNSGNILEKAGYYQEMYAYAKHIGLDEEEVILEVYDVTNKQKPIYTSEKVVVPKGSKEICIPYTIKKTYKGKTEEEKKKEDRERKDIQIFFKIKAADTNFLIVSSNKEFENNLLTITNKGDIIDAYFCNSDDTEKRKFIESGKVAHLKIYATNMKNREVEILFFTRNKFHYSENITENELTWKLWSEIKAHNIKGEPFHSTKEKINDKGELLVELDTSKYKWIKENIIAVFKIKGKEGNEKGAYIKEWYSLILHSYPQLTKLAENKVAVKVGEILGIGKVKRVELEKKECICKQYDLVWGEKISCMEIKKVIEVSNNLKVDPNWLMTVIALETGESFNPAIGNGLGYVGLIQFGKSAADSLNITQQELVKMSFIEQMNYVQKYLEKNKTKYKTLTDLYLSVLYPSACGHGLEKEYIVLEGNAYKNNPLFWREKDEYEWVKEKDKNGKVKKYKKLKNAEGKTYMWEITEILEEILKKGELHKSKYVSCLEGDCLDTWDIVTNNRIKQLHPKIRCAVKNFINEVYNTMNIRLRVIDGFRSFSEQDNLYAQGRTTKGSIVTYAKGGESYHNYGLAIDVVEIKDGKIDWIEQENVLPKIAPIGKKWGFEWGGDWKKIKDKPHFQMVFGKKTKELKKLYNDNNNDHTKIPL